MPAPSAGDLTQIDPGQAGIDGGHELEPRVLGHGPADLAAHPPTGPEHAHACHGLPYRHRASASSMRSPVVSVTMRSRTDRRDPRRTRSGARRPASRATVGHVLDSHGVDPGQQVVDGENVAVQEQAGADPAHPGARVLELQV